MSSPCQCLGQKYGQTTCQNILQKCLSMCHNTVQAASQKICQCFCSHFYVRIHIRTCVQLNVYEYLDTAVKNDIKASTYPTRISFLRCPDEEENPAYRPHSDITQLSRSKATSIPAFRSNTSRSVPKRTTHRFGIPLAITYC